MPRPKRVVAHGVRRVQVDGDLLVQALVLIAEEIAYRDSGRNGQQDRRGPRPADEE
jgi:hypothetical protein